MALRTPTVPERVRLSDTDGGRICGRTAPMSSTSSTPTVEALRERGVWGPAMDNFAQWDPTGPSAAPA